MNEVITISTDNYAQMAKAMGIAGANTSTIKKSNNLNRLRIWHSPVMGQAEVNGKTKNVEVVEGGSYRLEVLDEDSSTYYYAKTAVIRPFMQRYMYRRYLANPNAKAGEPKGSFHRTIMSDNLNTDLKDNTGRFNCGKPTGFIEDFKALPTDMQDLIRQIKRVRDQFNIFLKKERLPLHHNMLLKETKENPLPNGSSFYTPLAQVNLSKLLDINPKDHKTFGNFVDWVKNYNDYIYKEWDEKSHARQSSMSDEDTDTVDQFIDVDLEGDKK